MEHFIVEPEQQDEDFDSMYFISWRYSPVLFFTALIHSEQKGSLKLSKALGKSTCYTDSFLNFRENICVIF